LKVATNSRRHQSSDNFTSVGYYERLAVLDLTQDIAAAISELSMADRSHVANVARRRSARMSTASTPASTQASLAQQLEGVMRLTSAMGVDNLTLRTELKVVTPFPGLQRIHNC
jgi:hypothetical protein